MMVTFVAACLDIAVLTAAKTAVADLSFKMKSDHFCVHCICSQLPCLRFSESIVRLNRCTDTWEQARIKAIEEEVRIGNKGKARIGVKVILKFNWLVEPTSSTRLCPDMQL